MKAVKLVCFGVLGCIFIFLGCSTTKDAFINRAWHSVGGEFNILYNGQLALEEGKKQLISEYKDDFWEILPVERLEVLETIGLDGSGNANFERAEEKATKAIQKHGMEIRGEERNPQGDEAFMLLGKARYYDQRFIPALEAFSYVTYHDRDSDILGQARVWREKVNIRLGNEVVALKNLKNLLRYEDLSDQDYADTRAIMAQAYINLKHLDSAMTPLRTASAYTRKNEEKGRYNYILGQLYQRLELKDSAHIAFDRVIDLNRKSSRSYLINAHIEKARMFDIEKGDHIAHLGGLFKLAESWENKRWLDIINREIGDYYRNIDSVDLASKYFNKSIRKTSDNKPLNALNYENLGVINFDRNLYTAAGAYFDSTLVNLPENSKKFRVIRRKRDNLDDVIKYEKIVKRNDSIIDLYNMTPDKREAYFLDIIEKIKLERAEALAAQEESATSRGFAGGANTNFITATSEGPFYFYNPVTVAYGKNAFRQRWGDRVREDNWRWLTKPGNIVAENSDTQGAAENGDDFNEDLISLDWYLDKVPSDSQVIDSLKTERNFSNYQLGLIYKEKFKEYLLAADKLTTVLASNPDERLILPAKYNLYDIYKTVGNPLADRVKADIIENFPESRYARILIDPESLLNEEKKKGPDVIYNALYKEFENEEFEKVAAEAAKQAKNYEEEDIILKFEMLKATALGRAQGLIPYTETLNYIALNYPNHDIGKKAQSILNDDIPKLPTPEFIEDNLGEWKLAFSFKPTAKEKIAKLDKTLKKVLNDLKYTHLKTSKDYYDKNTVLLIVHGFNQRDFAEGFAELIRINKKYKVKDENFAISSKNYEIVQIHKKLKDYLKQETTKI